MRAWLRPQRRGLVDVHERVAGQERGFAPAVDEPGNLRVAGRIDGCPGAANRHELTGEAGCCLQQLDLDSAADMIRSMPIAGAPDGPATPEAGPPGVYWRSSARPPAFAVAETRTGHTARS